MWESHRFLLTGERMRVGGGVGLGKEISLGEIWTQGEFLHLGLQKTLVVQNGVPEAFEFLKIVCINASVSFSGERIYNSPLTVKNFED